MSHPDSTPSHSPPRATTSFVDWGDLEAKLTARAAESMTPGNADRACNRATGGRRRVITSIDAETEPVRANVQDSARAVLTWVAAVTEHDTERSLDDVLDRCLRPSPDVTEVNYEALASEINAATGTQLSAKRVRTAIDHLRRARGDKPKAPVNNTMKHQLDDLRDRLEANHAALLGAESDERAQVRRLVGTEVLGAVRRAASRVIEADFGEGIPASIDVDELEGRFLDFVRAMVRDQSQDQPRDRAQAAAQALGEDLHRLLVTLADYDGSAEYDVRLVVGGSRVVADLLGPESLPGVLAQLNVLVAGRALIESELYLAEMRRLADVAISLKDDAETKRYMNWVRRLPEEQRAPSPTRVASYCLNNLATHALERLFTGDFDDANRWLPEADRAIDQMKQQDSGFQLIRPTQLIAEATRARLTGDPQPLRDLVVSLGRDKALAVLQDLMRYESNEEIVDAVRHEAAAAIPELKHQLLRL